MAAASSEPKSKKPFPPRDEPMEVDLLVALAPSPSSSLLTAPRGLQFPGKFFKGAREVVFHDLHNLSKANLRDLCNGFRLRKTGNKATLMDRVQRISADRKDWDSLLPGARTKHRGPRDGGVMKGPKKGATKRSTQRPEPLFGGTADGTGSTTQPCLPTERSREDTRTDEERAELLAWADRCVALNEYEDLHGDTDKGTALPASPPMVDKRPDCSSCCCPKSLQSHPHLNYFFWV